MKHPTITEWADFSRELASEARRDVLQAHLDEGCGLCRTTLATLARISETAAGDLAMSPPAGALRSVKAFFATQHPETVSLWAELRLRTVFDSALAPAPTGSRAPGRENRQLLFESDRYTVELSLEPSVGTADSVLRGQILEAHGEPRSHTPVFLVGDGEVLGRAISEQHGNFEMSGRLDQPCELWVFPDDQSRIRLTLTTER